MKRIENILLQNLIAHGNTPVLNLLVDQNMEQQLFAAFYPT